MHWGRHPPPQADILPLADTPWAETPLGRHPPCPVHVGRRTPPCPVHAGIHSPCPVHAGIHTPLPSTCWDTPPPHQQPLLRMVRILLECILVFSIFCYECIFNQLPTNDCARHLTFKYVNISISISNIRNECRYNKTVDSEVF